MMQSPRSGQLNCQWYSPNTTRADAETLLKEGSPEDGFFLVRDSTSAPGDFGLSVVVGGDVIHYQIRQHGDDAFYSIDEGPMFHGLDALVEYYRSTGEGGLAARLTSHVAGAVPPPHCLLRGASNLLHRAINAGDLKIVSELLNSGYEQVNFKDADGQTALHLAARLRRAEILPLLLEYGCSPNVRDSHGLMPLHYAARENDAQGIRRLVDAGASLQARSSELNWVPLHEAAHAGALEAVKTLLALNAPCRPRDRSDRLPADLAREAGHMACVDVLVRYKPPMPRRMRSDWLHGSMSRAEAEKKLHAGGFNKGDYLLRTSARKNSTVLSMVADDKVYHFEIQETRAADGELQYVYIDDGPYLDSLEHLVEHYSTLSDGLQCRLLHPLPPSAEDAHRAIADNRREVLGPPPPLPLPRALYATSGTIAAVDLEFGACIGDGEFGKVYQGRWRDPRGTVVDVAVKTCQGVDKTSEADREVLRREAECMRDLRHTCIVRFLGVVEHEPLMLVQELVARGSLLDYLTSQPHGVSLDNDFKLWAGQVASGMEYLEKKRMVHRDLAARNILVASSTQVKISDFGFSRLLAGDRDYYVASEGGKWPIKWYAPEAINYGQFSHASDVWSFGILLWEMFSYGQPPYGDMPGTQAFLEIVEQGERLPKPEYCPGGIYEVMRKCWRYEAKERPSFCILHKFFSSDNEYRNLSDLTSRESFSSPTASTLSLGPPSATENGLSSEKYMSAATAAEVLAARAEELLAVSPAETAETSPCPSPSGNDKQVSDQQQSAAAAAAEPPVERPPKSGVSAAQAEGKTAASRKSSNAPQPPRKPSTLSVFKPNTSNYSHSPKPEVKPHPSPTTKDDASTDTPELTSTISFSGPGSSPQRDAPSEPSASDPSEVYDVLSAARSVPPATPVTPAPAGPSSWRPPVPPKPALMVRRRPPPVDDLLYDAPRSHNLQRLRSESAPPSVLAADAAAVSGTVVGSGKRPSQPTLSVAEISVSVPPRPTEPEEGEGERDSAPPPPPPPLSPYSQLGLCGDSETYDVPTSPLLSPVIDVVTRDSDTYDVPSPLRPTADSHS